MSARLVAIASLILLAITTAARAACPAPALDLQAWVRPRPLPIHIYFDGSQSMAGYASAGNDAPVIADLLQLLGDHGAALSQPVRYFAFGQALHEMPAARAAVFATAAPYDCHSCDNQESRIDSLLRRVAPDNRRAVSVIVTDMWLDNHAFHGSPQVALGQPLRQIIAAGGAVALIGVRAPFAGKIYDVPGVGTYAFKGDRLLFTLVIGPEAEVADTVALLRASGSPAFGRDRINVALFASGGRARPVQPPRPTGGGGVSTLAPLAILPDVPHYGIDRALAARQGGAVAGRFDARIGVRPDSIWQGVLTANTYTWVLDGPTDRGCAAAVFRQEAALPTWPRHAGTVADFRLDARAANALRPGRTYLLVGRVGVTQLAVPNPDTAWLRDWSLSPAAAHDAATGRARRFGALNLADLAAQMEQAVAAARPRGRMTAGFRFLLTVT